jgi:hypothetical protein
MTVCNGDVFAVSAGKEKLVATMLATIMTVGVRQDVPPPPLAPREGLAQDQPMRPRWCPCHRLRGVKHTVRNVVAR